MAASALEAALAEPDVLDSLNVEVLPTLNAKASQELDAIFPLAVDTDSISLSVPKSLTTASGAQCATELTQKNVGPQRRLFYK